MPIPQLQNSLLQAGQSATAVSIPNIFDVRQFGLVLAFIILEATL
jgi:hypothetical protein